MREGAMPRRDGRVRDMRRQDPAAGAGQVEREQKKQHAGHGDASHSTAAHAGNRSQQRFGRSSTLAYVVSGDG